MTEHQDKQVVGGIVAAVSDLFFGSRISGAARAAGVNCRLVRDAQGLEQAMTDPAAALVLVDMSLAGSTALECLNRAQALAPVAERIAFYSHVQHELAELARKAGATQVLPHSKFVEQLEEMVRKVRMAKGEEGAEGQRVIG